MVERYLYNFVPLQNFIIFFVSSQDFIKNIINDTEINDQTVKVVQSKKLETPHTARQNNVIE